MIQFCTRALVISSTFLVVAGCASREPERPQLSPERKQELYERFVLRHDVNLDRVVTCEDIAISRTRLFTSLDVDGDGSLAASEYRLAPFEDKSFVFYPFEKVDTDTSVLVSKAEFAAVPDSQFGRFDRNRDCTVSVEEAAEATRDQFEERRGDRRDSGRGEGRRPPPR